MVAELEHTAQIASSSVIIPSFVVRISTSDLFVAPVIASPNRPDTTAWLTSLRDRLKHHSSRVRIPGDLSDGLVGSITPIKRVVWLSATDLVSASVSRAVI